jgi:hypothetical protein
MFQKCCARLRQVVEIPTGQSSHQLICYLLPVCGFVLLAVAIARTAVDVLRF